MPADASAQMTSPLGRNRPKTRSPPDCIAAAIPLDHPAPAATGSLRGKRSALAPKGPPRARKHHRCAAVRSLTECRGRLGFARDSPLGEMDSNPRSHFTALTVSDLPLVGSVKGPSSVDSHSLLEEAGFEPSVPPTGTAFFTEGNELYPLPINHQVGDHASSGPL